MLTVTRFRCHGPRPARGRLDSRGEGWAKPVVTGGTAATAVVVGRARLNGVMSTPHVDTALVAALAADLRAAGYTTDRLRDAWGSAADGALGRGHALPASRALRRDTSALAVIARLFGLGEPVDAELATEAFPTVDLAGLEVLGLARCPDGSRLAIPDVLIRPQAFIDDDGFGEWWIASDLDEAALRARGGSVSLPEDHVLGVGGASLTLAGLQPTAGVARVLDLGAGCGIQALRARRVAGHVVATDISQRALAFTRFNAALNGVDHIETRAGSLFEPVAGEEFDRVVSNPPFVITPRAAGVPAYEYRDGGREGDGLVAEVVSSVGAVLAPGGVAVMLGNWETRRTADGRVDAGLDRVRAWVEASPVPLDAWIIEREPTDPVAYAELWIRDGGTVPGMPGYDALLGAWLDDFERRRVTQIGFGYVVLRRAADEPRLARYERVTHAIPESGLGAHISRALAAHDALAVLDDDALAASTLLVAPDVTEARHLMPGAEDPTVIELRQGGGLGRTISVDSALAGIVGACDGDLSIGQIVDAVASLLDVSAEALRADVLPRLRELVFTGFLRFA